ncbi:MAG: DUF3999 family protein [Sphingomonadales bacterium]|nr:DUF3999 family protein [Sphingomonadales bacterium]
MTSRCFRALAPALALLITGCDKAAPAGDPARPDSYALRLPIEPAKGDGAQRIVLPAQALVALQRADGADLRVFDGRGRMLPLARLSAAEAETRQTLPVPTYAVSGPADNALHTPDVTIRIANGAGVLVDAQGSALSGTAQVTLAALLDTRVLEQPVVAVTLDADLPAGQPVTFTAEASDNLKDWTFLADKVLFHPADAVAPLGPDRIDLPGQPLKGRYLRISWSGEAGVTIRSAQVTTATAAPVPRIAIATSGAALDTPHELRFDLPAGTPPAAIRVTEAAPDGILPVQLYGRNNREQPWTLLGAGTVRQDARAGGNLIDTSGSAFVSFRLEADKRTSGFSATPRLELLYAPVTLLAAFNGAPPYTLAAGNKAATEVWLARQEVAPDDGPAPDGLPLATAKSDSAPPALAVAPAAPGNPFTGTRAALWAALLAGTAMLGFAAIRLLRGNAEEVRP